jgi:acyl carrier protein
MHLEEIFVRVLGIPAQHLADEASPMTIPAWNSLKHIELIVQIEAAYRVRFTRPEIASLRSVGEIRSLLSKKGVDTGSGDGQPSQPGNHS